MKYSARVASVLGLIAGAKAGTTIWSGSFNSYPNVSAFDNWSWSNEVGEYQWYIHGTEPTSHYLALDPSYKNPADTSETNGLRMTIDSTAQWNSQMERSELIPQTTQNLGTGELYYHFSIMQDGTNPPDSTLEHQIFFFESHFTQLKYGVSPSPTDLQWMIQDTPYWSAPFTAGTWFNFAYDIDFDAGTVGLWASTGSDPLTKVVDNIATSTSTNSEDFHVGILRLVNGPGQEDYYVSGVYVESGPITTAIGDGSAPPPPASGSGTTSVAPTTSVGPTTTVPPPPTTTTPVTGPAQTQYGQCGGTGYTGPTTCASPFTCEAISPPYYYQCL
ncbi:carbohydrate-binding module family 1 protein [Phanerochaete carnosa HHB-10118-sp]|uniref:Carbohydrate-binding module family 1 protein n=1 Tax=Phanerochaete carnosa (strain HHB-10118-sp) TaxID=650164 RepID=K5VYF9_PHACS|nr:carbohydrate-binding module family 1 protein [Phanerochaete carnosa HHB-10118-sp]EKM51820.1 carbohydrate-binding module family 1 protein [Phanerochaete carnosa HHB-10118-sp]